MVWLCVVCEKYESRVMEQADKIKEEPTMKLWKIQRKSIAEYVQAKNICIQDIGKSRYLKENPALTSVNPLLIDLNDFQFLMPPIQYFPPYTEKSVDRICTALEKGQIRQSEFPSYVIQAHIPYIAPRDLVNVYPLFEL